MLPRNLLRNDRRLVLAFGMVCLAMVVFAGCNSNSASTKKESTPTPTPIARAAFILPAGFTTYKGQTFHVAYPTGWNQQNPANGTGVQYQGPTNQMFVVASLGNVPGTPEEFNAAFCSPKGFNGTPAGAAKMVKIGGESWMQQQCNDVKDGKTAVVESTVYNKALYYMVYESPDLSFKTNQSQYFNTMEQSFTFVTPAK